MDVAAFSAQRPYLYHLTTPEAWDLIRQHGLLPAATLLARAGLCSETDRDRVYRARRRGAYAVEVPGLGKVTLRDQKPMIEGGLLKALQGAATPCGKPMTPLDWVDLINGRVFFWTSRKHAETLQRAAAVRHQPGCLLTLASEPLLRRYHQHAELTTFNVGYALRKAKRRDRSSFAAFGSYPAQALGKVRELTLCTDLPDVCDYIENVSLYGSSGSDGELRGSVASLRMTAKGGAG